MPLQFGEAWRTYVTLTGCLLFAMVPKYEHGAEQTRVSPEIHYAAVEQVLMHRETREEKHGMSALVSHKLDL